MWRWLLEIFNLSRHPITVITNNFRPGLKLSSGTNIIYFEILRPRLVTAEGHMIDSFTLALFAWAFPRVSRNNGYGKNVYLINFSSCQKPSDFGRPPGGAT